MKIGIIGAGAVGAACAMDRRDRDTMVNTVAPVWDGNETWLVQGAAGSAYT